ncbi:phage head morphogenesis protein [Bordetella avium]|uniref:phage head morphogenesis protein n=1 Tax=Bordetella avium TaxID=521 RepID=UPI000E6A3306|nr:phage minor head protein [Bordetella avium]RIQ65773.1 phage head morphogenesis protein [Bordetella avium]
MLTKRRQQWGQERQAQQFKGAALAYPLSAELQYRERMSRLIAEMIEEYGRELKRLYAKNPEITQDASPTTYATRLLASLGKKWSREFGSRAGSIVDQFLGRVDRFAKQNLAASLREMSGGITIKTPQMPADLAVKMQASTAENVGLIKSIPAKFQERIQGIVLRSIQSGGQGTATIFKEIQKLGQVTKDRARLIAVDQTRKVSTAINNERMKSAGVRQFEWIHSGGGFEPRSLHVEYDGQVFDMDNPPIIDKTTGERGLPGQLINCKCRMRPVIDFSGYLNE